MLFKDYSRKYFDNISKLLDEIDLSQLELILTILMKTRDQSGLIYICGNGGSASTASHMVCDFNKGVSLNSSKKFKFISLNENISHITAIANDLSYDDIFLKQIENVLKPTDLLFVISASGNSKNLIKAIEYAKSIGSVTIGFLGFTGGTASKLLDHSLIVPSMEYGPVEDIHLIFDHLITNFLMTYDE